MLDGPRPRRRAPWLVALGALAAIGAASCGLFRSPPVLRAFPTRQYELSSGLRLEVEEESNSGVVGIAWVVDAGALDDPAAPPELAHLVEHLALRVPDATGMSLARHLDALGADGTNAMTTPDRTIFSTFVPPASANAALAAMATRFADPSWTLTDALLAKEGKVVAEELRLRHGLSGSVGGRLALAGVYPPGHPLARLADDVTRESPPPISVANVSGFLQGHYRPEQLTLLISGPLSPDDDQRLIAALPAALRGTGPGRRPTIRRPLAAAPTTEPADAGIAIRAANVSGPELWVAWPLPAANALSAVPFEVLAEIVERTLMDKVTSGNFPEALGVGCRSVNSTLGGGLICRITSRSGANAAELKGRVAAMVAGVSAISNPFFGEAGGRQAAVWMVRRTTLASALSLDQVPRRLMLRANLVHDVPDATIPGVIQAIESVTPEVISALAHAYLREEFARGLLLVPPAATVGPAAHTVNASAEPLGSEGEDDGAGDTDLQPLGTVMDVARRPGIAAARTTRLANGLTVIALHRSGLPFVSMVLGFHAEPQPGDPPGLGNAAMFGQFYPLAKPPVERGLQRSTFYSADRYEETISSFSVVLQDGLRLIADEAQTLSVRWPAPAFDRWLEMSARSTRTPAGRAQSGFARALWQGHPYDGWFSREQVQRLTSNQIRAWLARVRRPANGALVVVGDIDPSSVLRRAAHALGGWSGDPTPFGSPPPPPNASARPVTPVLRIADPGGETAVVHFGCFLPPVRDLRGRIVGEVFDELVGADLTTKLRTEKGVTYSVRLQGAALRGGTFVVDGHFDVSPAASPAALDILERWLGSSGAEPDEASVIAARWRVAQRSMLESASNEGLARKLFESWNADLPISSLDEFPEQLASVGLADIEAALAACRASAVVSVTQPGAP